MVLCCALGVSRLVRSFSRRSEIPCHHPTKRVEYLLMLLPLHNHKTYCVRMSDGVAEIDVRLFPALLAPLYILEGG